MEQGAGLEYTTVGGSGEGEHLQSHISSTQTQLAAALQIFAIGSRQSSPKSGSNRKDTENKVNVSDSIS